MNEMEWKKCGLVIKSPEACGKSENILQLLKNQPQNL